MSIFRIPTHLPEDQLIPQCMCIVASGMQSFGLYLDSPPKDCTFEPRYIACKHGRLVYPVEDTRNGGEHVRLEDLGIFQKTKRISSKIPNASTDSYGTDFQ
jgi:hypothetical protein